MLRNRRDTALLARIIENSKCFFSTRKGSSKNEAVVRIKRIRKEENLLFGKLIETKKQKTKRLKLESKGEISKADPSTVNSEYAWIIGSSLSSKKISVLTVPKAPLDLQHNKNFEIKSNSNCDTQEIPKSEAKVIETPIVTVDPVNKGTSIKKLETINKKKSSLPNDVAQNLLQFPIFAQYKGISDRWNDECKIMAVSPMEDKSCLRLPSVTKILTATMSEEAKAVLEKWKMNMIEKLGLKGFELYKEELFADGKLLHSMIMYKLSQKPYEVPDKIKQSFLSLSEVFENVDKVRAIESHVIHPRLMYRGIVDCVASYRGELCLIDWKKSDKRKDSINSTFDAPLQLASYIGALNADLKYPYQIKKGVIVIAYTTGAPATVHEMNEESLQSYWNLWLQRLQNYHVSLNTPQSSNP